MATVIEGLREASGGLDHELEIDSRGVGRIKELRARGLRLAKEGTRRIVAGETTSVDDIEKRLKEIIRDLKATDSTASIGWQREEAIERISSVLVRLLFVEICFPFLKNGYAEFDPILISWRGLGVSRQAWIWGIADGPDELAEAILRLREDARLTVEKHISILRGFLVVADWVEDFLSALGRHEGEVLSISGDPRRSIPEELRKLRQKTIVKHREELVQLIASVAPEEEAAE